MGLVGVHTLWPRPQRWKIYRSTQADALGIESWLWNAFFAHSESEELPCRSRRAHLPRKKVDVGPTSTKIRPRNGFWLFRACFLSELDFLPVPRHAKSQCCSPLLLLSEDLLLQTWFCGLWFQHSVRHRACECENGAPTNKSLPWKFSGHCPLAWEPGYPGGTWQRKMFSTVFSKQWASACFLLLAGHKRPRKGHENLPIMPLIILFLVSPQKSHEKATKTGQEWEDALRAMIRSHESSTKTPRSRH